MRIELLTQIILKINAMKNHKKIGAVAILGHEKVNSLITESEKENIPIKPKTINEIAKEERAIKITAPHRFEELDIKTLLRNERGVTPPDFYNKRKKK